MTLILNIDSSGETASVCLSDLEKSLQLDSSGIQKDHASWIHGAIESVLQKAGHRLSDLKAIAVTTGPGSYTGLRIGLSTAKGLCYALQIPLISVGTLEMMAQAVKEDATDIICPVIDARRMEVFTAVYDQSLHHLVSPHALILDKNSFKDLLSGHQVLFTGSGIKKLKEAINNPNAFFSSTMGNAFHMLNISGKKFQKNEFTDLAYAEPLYIKDFYTPGPASST